MMACRSPDAEIMVYIPHLWGEMVQRKQKHLMTHTDREGREAEQKNAVYVLVGCYFVPCCSPKKS